VFFTNPGGHDVYIVVVPFRTSTATTARDCAGLSHTRCPSKHPPSNAPPVGTYPVGHGTDTSDTGVDDVTIFTMTFAPIGTSHRFRRSLMAPRNRFCSAAVMFSSAGHDAFSTPREPGGDDTTRIVDDAIGA
jgi:hypothetical protein